MEDNNSAFRATKSLYLLSTVQDLIGVETEISGDTGRGMKDALSIVYVV